MQRKNYKAYFTVEAAVLYPIVLGVIVLMTYLLFFQYDRCLLEQDMGRAAVRSGRIYMLTFTSTPDNYENHADTLADVKEFVKFH